MPIAPARTVLALRLLAPLLVLLTLFPAAARADHDRWYIVEMMGGRAGWMHSTQTTTPPAPEADADNADAGAAAAPGAISSQSAVRFSLKRGDLKLEITMETAFVETAAGEPISMRSVQKLGTSAVTQEYTFKDDGVEVTTTQGGQSKTAFLPRPEGVWLTPAAAERYVRQRFLSGAKEITVRTIDPSAGLAPIVATRTAFEPATIQATGRAIQATKMSTTTSVMPGVRSTEWVDAAGELVKSETMLGGITVTMTAATREEAIAEGAAPEVMTTTFITPDRPIDRPRSTRRAVYVLAVDDGELPELPATGAQRVEVLDPRSARLTVDADAAQAAPASEAADPAFLAATTAVDSDDDRIAALARRALRSTGADPARRAETLRRAVHDHIIHKNLGVGFATASETVRTKTGDCTEHGVLLAAVLRADGIPARVASGLIYADDFAGAQHIFGYHMWAQALLEVDGQQRWVDLDATLPDSTPFDATHITLSTSSLADADPGASMLTLAQVLGRLSIKVEETSTKPTPGDR